MTRHLTALEAALAEQVMDLQARLTRARTILTAGHPPRETVRRLEWELLTPDVEQLLPPHPHPHPTGDEK